MIIFDLFEHNNKNPHAVAEGNMAPGRAGSGRSELFAELLAKKIAQSYPDGFTLDFTDPWHLAQWLKTWQVKRWAQEFNRLQDYEQSSVIDSLWNELRQLGFEYDTSEQNWSPKQMPGVGRGVAEQVLRGPLSRDARRERVAPTDRDTVRRELWKYVRSLDQPGSSNRAHAMAYSCPTWGRLYRQFNDDVSELLSRAPTKLLAQALEEIQSKFQVVAEGKLNELFNPNSSYPIETKKIDFRDTEVSATTQDGRKITCLMRYCSKAKKIIS